MLIESHKLSCIKITPLLETLALEDIDDTEYFSVKYKNYISNSRLGLLKTKGIKAFFEGFKQEYNSSFEFGSNLHQLILQPESYELINSVFKNKAIKEEIIEKLRPFFTLKVIPQREIDKVYSSVEKIAPEKIDFLEEFKYQEEKYDSKNIYETQSKSVGLSDFDLDLSASIFGHKQTLNYDFKEEKLTDTSELSSKIHCIHSIVVSLQNKIQAEFTGSITNFSAQLNLKGEKKDINEKSSESINGIENLSIKMEGGDYLGSEIFFFF